MKQIDEYFWRWHNQVFSFHEINARKIQIQLLLRCIEGFVSDFILSVVENANNFVFCLRLPRQLTKINCSIEKRNLVIRFTFLKR